MKKAQLNKTELLNRLDKVKYDPGSEEDQTILSGLSMAKSLPKLADINPEKEYILIKKAAERLIDTLPSADEID